MKSTVRTSYGGFENLEYVDLPHPNPQSDQILIKVINSSYNRTDEAALKGKPWLSRIATGIFKPKHLTLGCEFSGIVEEVGRAVTQFKPGDRVYGFDDDRFGGHAEYLVVDGHAMLARKPETMPFQLAGIATEGFHYALTIIEACEIEVGQKVLVNGATGAIGSAAVQILKSMGVEVYATCQSEHFELVKKLGAQVTLDYTTEYVKSYSTFFDVYLDAAGKSSFSQAHDSIKKDGIYVSTELGEKMQNVFFSLVTSLVGSYRGRRVLFPIPRKSKDHLRYLNRLFEAKQYSPLLDRTYALKQLSEAAAYVEGGNKIGNVSIDI